MYLLICLLAKLGIKPVGIRSKLREKYRNHERGNHNLSVHWKKAGKRASTSDVEAECYTKAKQFSDTAEFLRKRIAKLQ